jgi:hypothetical protein
VVVAWIVAFFWILGASTHCSDAVAFSEIQGICLWRGLAGMSCIFGIELAFGTLAGFLARAKGYRFIIGFMLGFFLNAIGGYITMSLSPKGSPRFPMPRKRKLLLSLSLLAVVILAVVLSMMNRGVF